MFEIDCCDVKMKVLSQVFHKRLYDRILSLSSSSKFNHDILALACLLLKQTFVVQETC